MTTPQPNKKVRSWLVEPMPALVAKSIERLASADDVRHVVVLPDLHLAHDVCIGTVLATSRLIYPGAVGGDIGCGMAAVRFDADADLLADEPSAARVLSGLYQSVPTNRHSAGTMPAALPKDLDAAPLSDARLEKLKRRDGRVQLGTLGRGNHFLEFQADHDGRLWLMVHSGSRAMGRAITTHHLAGASTNSTRLPCFDADTASGQAYLADVAWALRYAEQNRLAMVSAVAEFLPICLGSKWTPRRSFTAITTTFAARRTLVNICGFTARAPSPPSPMSPASFLARWAPPAFTSPDADAKLPSVPVRTGPGGS